MVVRLLLLVFALAGLAIAVPGEPLTLPQAAVRGGSAFVRLPTYPDPVPIRRVYLASDTDARLRNEVFHRLTQEEFDSKVQLAAKEVASRAKPPRFQEARYRASFSAGQLSGSAEWKLVMTGQRPGFASLGSISFALGLGTWSDGRPALLTQDIAGDRPETGTVLWTEGNESGTVSVPWSLRSTESADEDRFEVVAPAVPVSLWELQFPADRTPVVPTVGVLLSGPFPGDSSNNRLWRISAGNLTRWELILRHAIIPEELLPTRATRIARHRLAPGAASATFEFKLDSPRRPLREWSFQVESPFSVLEVVGDDVDRWNMSGTKLKVTLREAVLQTRLRIGVQSPLPAGTTSWPCPTLQLLGGNVSTESIELILHPDFKLDGWTPGDYRLTAAGIPSDRGYRLEFTGTFSNIDREFRRPPTIRLRPAEVELTTEETLDWYLAPGRNRLSAQLRARVLRGPVPTLSLQLAPGYSVESAAAVPDDPGMTWAAKGGNTWVFEPSRPLSTGQSVELRIEVRGPPAPFAGDPILTEPLASTVAWPKFSVLSSTERRGTIRIATGGGLKAVVQKSALSTEDNTISYRGREPEGTLALTSGRSVLSLVAVEFVDRTAVRLHCRAEGPVYSITAYAPGESTVRASTSNATVRKLPVVGTLSYTPLLTSLNGWGAVAMAGLPDALNGSLWRVNFATPLRGDFVLQVEDLPHDRSGKGTQLPVVCGAEIGSVVQRGDGPHCNSEDFRRSLQTFPPTICFRDTTAVPQSSQMGHYLDLRLLTIAEAKNRLVGVLTGSVVGRVDRTIPVEMPDGATFESATVAGKKLVTVSVVGATVFLPLPTTPDNTVTFEVRYRLPVGGNLLLKRLESPTPVLHGEPEPLRFWAFPDGCQPFPSLVTQPFPEANAAVVIWAIPSNVVQAVSHSLAALLLGLAVALVRVGGRGLIPFAALGLVLGAAVWGAPAGWSALLRPAFAVVAGGVVGIVLVRPIPVKVKASSTVTKTSLLFVLFLAGMGSAQAPAFTTVYYVPELGNANRLRVHVPPALLDRLDRLAAPALPPAVILSATYEAVAGEETTTFDATYAVLGTQDGPRALVLPLAGVRLESATIDGKEAYPDAPDATRFVFSIPGPGRHELKVRFAVPTLRRGADREIRLGIPDVPSAEVRLQAGASARQPDVLTRRGGQKLTTNGSGPRVEAQHGGGKSLAVRWRESGPGDGVKPTIAVREFDLWDIKESEATLAAALAFRVTGGPVTQLHVDLPDSVDPVRVAIRGGEELSPLNRLKSWSVSPPSNGWRRLEVRLLEPCDGRLLVLIVGNLGRPVSQHPVLRFPRVPEIADADRESFHAIRLTGKVSTDGVGVQGGIDFPAEPVQKEFDQMEFNWNSGPLARMVRRAPNSTVEFRPNLQPVRSYTAGPSEVIVTVGQKLAYDGLMRTTDPDTYWMEFTTPGNQKPTDVRGTSLAGWAYTSGQVQAWLRQPTPSAGVRWSFTGNNDLIPPSGLPADGIPVEIAWPHWSGSTGTEPIRATIRAAAGLELTPIAVPGLQSIPGATAGEWNYNIEPGNHPPGRFLLKPAIVKPVTAPKPKLIDTTPAKTDTAPSPPPLVSTTSPPPEPSPTWPHGILAWCGGYLVLLWLIRYGSRWRPETAGGIGALAALAVGWTTLLGGALLVVACIGIGLRICRLTVAFWSRILTKR